MSFRTIYKVCVIPLLLLNRTFCKACGLAEYSIGTECCPLCPAGSHVVRHCTAETNTSCLPCLRSTFTDKPNGYPVCQLCTICDHGLGVKTVQECTPSSDTVCGVLDGHYCIDADEGGCRVAHEHTACTPGQFIKQPGTTSSDTVCEDCPANTYSNGSSAYCKPHTACTPGQFIKYPGTQFADTVCEDCHEDMYSDGTSMLCTPHTECDSKGLMTVKQGDRLSDSECGGHTWLPVVVGSTVAGLAVLAAAVTALTYRWRKKRGSFTLCSKQDY